MAGAGVNENKTFILNGVEGTIKKGITEFSNELFINFNWNGVKAEYTISEEENDTIYLANFEKISGASSGNGKKLLCFIFQYIKNNIKSIKYVTLLSLPTTRNKNNKKGAEEVQHSLNNYYKSLGFEYKGDPALHFFKAPIDILLEKCVKLGGYRKKTRKYKKKDKRTRRRN